MFRMKSEVLHLYWGFVICCIAASELKMTRRLEKRGLNLSKRLRLRKMVMSSAK